MAIGDVLTLRVVGRYQAQNIVNTLHYKMTDQNAPEHSICLALCTEWSSDIQATWLGRHIDTYELVGLKAFRQSGVSKRPGFLSIGVNGDVVGTEVISAVCRTITLYTDSAKPQRRGRVMLSGGEALQFDDDDGSVTTAEIALLQVLAGLLTDPLVGVGNTWQLCIPATELDPVEDITTELARETPSIVRSRRIRQFLIG